MLDSFSTNATIAKIHAIYGNMYTKENYNEMANKRSVPEVAEYLKKSYRFKEVLRDVDPHTVHRGFLEELLKEGNFNTYERLCSFQNLDKIPFYNFLVQEIEVDQIISAVSRIDTHVSAETIANVPTYVKEHSRIDLMELAAADDIDDIKNALKKTPYLKFVSRIEVDENGVIDYGQFEREVRTFHYERLIESIEKSFSKKDQDELKRIIFSEIDMINMINAYRKRKYFGFDTELLKMTQLPFTRMGKHRINSFYEKETPEEMLEMMTKILRMKENVDDTQYIEIKFRSDMCRYFKHIIARSESAPVVVYAFTKLCDIEVDNIIHIIEAIRYGVDPALIKKELLVY